MHSQLHFVLWLLLTSAVVGRRVLLCFHPMAGIVQWVSRWCLHQQPQFFFFFFQSGWGTGTSLLSGGCVYSGGGVPVLQCYTRGGQKKIFPTNFYTQKIEKKNFFFRFARVCACCDGVNMRSEMSIFDLKFMCQFLHDFWPENPYMHFRSKILISERKLTPSQHAQTRANRKKKFFFFDFLCEKMGEKFFPPL